MLFNLEVYQDSDEIGGLPVCIAKFSNVDVTWTNAINKAKAKIVDDNFKKFEITMITFDDYPIEIYEDCIEIVGILQEESDTNKTVSNGYWKLTKYDGW